MGHDTHFLGRLDRVSDAHVELALELYRDEALLREVLNRASLPEGIERLAISLDDTVEGPFVIVTREGRFVTCLGRGMHVRKEQAPYVLPRARLDAAVSKVERMRERVADIQRLVRADDGGTASRAIKRLASEGLRFCREDAQTLLDVMPLIAQPIAAAVPEALLWLDGHRHEISYLRFDRLKPHEEDIARGYGMRAWALAHLLVLSNHEDVRAVFDELPRRDEFWLGAMTQAFELGSFAHATRALWRVGRNPRGVLGLLKALSTDPRQQVRALRELGLGTVAFASSKLRAEALKALAPRIPEAELDPSRGLLPLLSNLAAESVRMAHDQPEILEQVALVHGRVVAARLFTGETEPSAEELARVPDDVARAIYCALPRSWLGTNALADGLPVMSGLLRWLAYAEPTDLFLPRAYASQLPFDEHPLVAVRAMVTPYAEASRLGRPKPVVRGAKVGRNDPCGCGSGKKAKRCCAAA